MAWWHRRRTPAGLAAALAEKAEPGERLLSWASTTGGAVLGATNRGLWEIAASQLGLGHAHLPRLRWDDIDKVQWQDPSLRVHPSGGGLARTFTLTDAGTLPRDIRARVETSIAWSQHHQLSSVKAGVRVVARRRPGDGPWDWRLVWDDGREPAEPAAVAEAHALLEAARTSAL